MLQVYVVYTVVGNSEVQGDSKRLIQFRTFIFPELYMVCK